MGASVVFHGKIILRGLGGATTPRPPPGPAAPPSPPAPAPPLSPAAGRHRRAAAEAGEGAKAGVDDGATTGVLEPACERSPEDCVLEEAEAALAGAAARRLSAGDSDDNVDLQGEQQEQPQQQRPARARQMLQQSELEAALAGHLGFRGQGGEDGSNGSSGGSGSGGNGSGLQLRRDEAARTASRWGVLEALAAVRRVMQVGGRGRGERAAWPLCMCVGIGGSVG